MEIKLDHVEYVYEKINYKKKEVLKDINLELETGKIHAIIGASGSGKTTLLELIDGLIFPTSGTIQVGEMTLSHQKNSRELDNLHLNVGYVFQFPEEQLFNQTVRKELEFSIKIYHYKEDQLEKRVLDAIKMVGLNESYLDKNPLILSSGEKRKIALASILILNPKVLLLDEPTIGLDDMSKKSLLQLLRILKNRYHKTIVIVSHDMNFLHKIVDTVSVLHEKTIVLSGTKYEVFKQVKLLKKYGIKAPFVMEFSDKVLQKKQIKIGYRDEINDLIKDIYRYVK